MNASHRDELGGFRFLRRRWDQSSIASNAALRTILGDIIDIEWGGRSGVDSALGLDCSRVFDSTQRASRRDGKHVMFALKSFLRLTEAEAARRFLGLHSLMRSLPGKVTMVSLDVSRNALTDDDAEVKKPCEHFPDRITLLSVCHTSRNAFGGMRNLAELDMSYNLIGLGGTDAIFSTLLAHPSCRVRRLDLACNGTAAAERERDSVVRNICRVLQHQNRSLVTLKINGSLLITHAIRELCRVVYDPDANLFDIPTEYNHQLRCCTYHSACAASDLSTWKMNEGGRSRGSHSTENRALLG